METEKLQKEIKNCIAKLGWSQKSLARAIFMEKNDTDNNLEITRFEERVKKDLSRKTTKPKRLSYYLDFITTHPDFKKIDIVIPQYHSLGILGDDMENEMKNISEKLSQMVAEAYPNQ